MALQVIEVKATKKISQKEKVNTVESNRVKTSFLIKNLTKKTIGNETAQAIIRMLETKTIGLKLFWLLCLLVCSSLCGYLVTQTLITYLSYPVYTTTTLVREMPTQFPKITICNSAIAQTEYAYEIIKELNENYSPGVSIFNQSQMRNLSLIDQENYFWAIYNIFLGRITSAKFLDSSRQKLSHSFDDLLLYCTFNDQTCTSSDFVWRWDPLYGNCYSFNSGFNSSGHRIDYKESLLSGALFGLQLNLYIGYNDNLNLFNSGYLSSFGFSRVYGLVVLIENNTYLSNNKQNVIALNGGTFNYMSMQRKFTSKLPKPYSECEIDNESPGHFDSPYYNLILNSPYQYNQEICVVQCMQEKAIQICNCSIPLFLDLFNRSCQTDEQSNCAMEIIFDGSFTRSSILSCIPICPLECNSTEFTFAITTQTITGLKYVSFIEQTPVFHSDFNSTPINEATASNKFVELFVYYDSLAYTSSSDSPSMDLVSFLGGIGGTLGLFLGVSVLSICELIHTLVESFLLVKRRLNKRLTTEEDF